MTLTTEAPTAPAWLNWVHPWYPAGLVGHIYDDCPELLHWEPAPKQGAGWLDPAGDNVCEECRTRREGSAK